MKSLTEYMEAAQTELFKKTGSFFAFSKQQFEEGKKKVGNENTADYMDMSGGLICLKAHAKELHDGLEKIYRDSIKQDMAENGADKIILRELANHECWYTGDYSNCVEKLEDYDIDKQRIKELFYKHCPEN